MEQITRIMHMEQILDEVTEVIASLSESLEQYELIQDRLQELSAYYGSTQWRADFDDDHAGRLPRDLKRGVLSEDAVYNLLMEHANLKKQLRHLGTL